MHMCLQLSLSLLCVHTVLCANYRHAHLSTELGLDAVFRKMCTCSHYFYIADLAVAHSTAQHTQYSIQIGVSPLVLALFSYNILYTVAFFI
jgi:hypothetical protein